MANIQSNNAALSAPPEKDPTDTMLIARMRLLLAISLALAMVTDASGGGRPLHSIWLVLAGYVVHSGAVYAGTLARHPVAGGRLMCWLDVCWYAVIVLFSGGAGNYFFLFFLAILTASFRWGFEEGARVALASALLFALSHLPQETRPDLSRLLLRMTFLLVFGYISARWGESQLELKRRLVLLRNVSRLSNPRFGMEQTLRSTLRQTAAFFGAQRCVCVLPGTTLAGYELLTLSRDDQGAYRFHTEQVDEGAVAPLLSPPAQGVIACTHGAPLDWRAGIAIHDAQRDKWLHPDVGQSASLAALLEAQSFISAPFSLRNRHGRLYLIAGERSLGRQDALFLHHLNEQAFPVIDNIDMLARMASDAASQERRKMALDIHDTTLQPYIGLKLGISALRNKASADNPLLADIDRLAEMTAHVISDLRNYSRTMRSPAPAEPLLRAALLRQIAQVRELYGIDVALQMESGPDLNDRLNAEIVQLVREGLHNICKHSLARYGAVMVSRGAERVDIDIVNESAGRCFAVFSPSSLAERTAALGGITHVREGSGGSTVVHMEIPI